MENPPPLTTYKLVALMTTFIAGASLLIAGMLVLRMDRTRDALRGKLQQCTCCREAIEPPAAK